MLWGVGLCRAVGSRVRTEGVARPPHIRRMGGGGKAVLRGAAVYRRGGGGKAMLRGVALCRAVGLGLRGWLCIPEGREW